MFMSNLANIATVCDRVSRSINPENPQGEKGAGGSATSELGKSRKGKAYLDLQPGVETNIAEMEGPGIINHIWITVQDSSAAGEFVLRDLIFRIYWDDSDTPSVETPLGDFFCCGFSTKCQVNSLPIVVAPYGGFNCYFPMPFRKKARITIENQHGGLIHAFFYTVNYCLVPEISANTGYFHALWRRTKFAKLGEDYLIVDGIKGKGQYVGTYLAWTALERYWWGEGEIKFYIDGDKEYPTICGTGVEDYVGGAWGFFEKDSHGNVSREETTYNTPFMGYPYHSCESGTKKIYGYDGVPAHGLYRWHVMDPIYFSEDLKVTIQQIGHNGDHLFERADDVASVAYWYQLPPCAEFPQFPSREERIPR
ncbi:glycoside hydrolase family 172 protein [uncultured Sphaerochaeta sp.]|uniref:glycoside hydrolase family 172 protein n=1 Tax=uncultured Sphaerochaeta sp. TaxID=886478 RepID=UPI002A0A4778|nr:glycoside hydrolase family 172 protein [uncultured Sphaerochaeta sp.]